MRCLRFSSLTLFAALCSPGQDLKELEKKITEFRLPNGLHFILLERHEAPPPVTVAGSGAGPRMGPLSIPTRAVPASTAPSASRIASSRPGAAQSW